MSGTLFSPHVLWILHLCSVAFMTGLIWLIQLVHYPLMDRVPMERFSEFHAAHSFRITGIVGPVMGLELLTGVGLVVLGRPWAWGFLLLTGVTFGATAFLSVPAHSRLSQGFDPVSHAFLVRSNWVRTLAWSLHLGLGISSALLHS